MVCSYSPCLVPFLGDVTAPSASQMLGAAEGGPEQGTSSCIELFLVTVLRSQVSLQGYREDRSNCGSEKGEEKAPMPVRI